MSTTPFSGDRSHLDMRVRPLHPTPATLLEPATTGAKTGQGPGNDLDGRGKVRATATMARA
jgi:hypothetical protein